MLSTNKEKLGDKHLVKLHHPQPITLGLVPASSNVQSWHCV